MVVFEDGLARKSEYRRFSIKGLDGTDDVASIREVVTRRFRRYQQETEDPDGPDLTSADPSASPEALEPQQRKFAYPPGLVVIDGGPAQVAAATAALEELGVVEVAVCGLAKRLEEVWLPGDDSPVILPRTRRGPVPAAAGPGRGATGFAIHLSPARSGSARPLPSASWTTFLAWARPGESYAAAALRLGAQGRGCDRAVARDRGPARLRPAHGRGHPRGTAPASRESGTRPSSQFTNKHVEQPTGGHDMSNGDSP